MALLNRAGRPEAKWNELIRRLAKGPVLPLEVNHFGWLDRGAIEAGLKGSFAVSGTTLAKYLRQMFGHWPRAEEMAGVPLALAAGNNPVAPRPAPQEDRAQLRQALGLPQDAFIAMRLGRPDPRKWSDLLIVHGARLLADLPRLHLVFLSAPASRHGVIRRLMGARVTLAPFTTERATVARYLAATDVMLHYARYGESFGYALAEAALAGLPVIAQATPWGDNAQAELIRDGETGFLVDDYAAARRALERLSSDPDFARALAAAASADIAARFGVAATWRLLRPSSSMRRRRARADRGPGRSGGGSAPAPCRRYRQLWRLLSAGRRMAAERPLYLRPWFWRLALRTRRNPEAAAGAMNLLIFLHDAYGGLGGISRNNRDVLEALAA